MIPRLLIAGTHSGVGKTTVAAGLIGGLRRRGIPVQPFKCGPDYIDPGFLSRAAGRPCRNLDGWLIPKERLSALLAQGCRGAGGAVLEGMMGLHDGAGPETPEGSTAELAALLRCPVLLVIDAAALARSAAALVAGYVRLDRRVRVAGCFLNRVAGPGHAESVRESVERLTGVPVIGWLEREAALTLPERHLGLAPAAEGGAWRSVFRRLAARLERTVDWRRLIRILRSAPPLAVHAGGALPAGVGGPAGAACRRVPIGVAQDAAFHFYYPENRELMEQLGARWVRFSPLSDRSLPAGIGGLYLGGGFPEVYAKRLSRNRRLHRAIRRAAAAGMPIYAECGGLMVLARCLRDGRGKRHSMIGWFPGTVRMTGRLQHFGYRRVQAVRTGWLARAGETARGHEFHHSRWERPPAVSTAPYRVRGAGGGPARPEGKVRGSVWGSYVHLHFWSCPEWAARFVRAADQWGRRHAAV